MRHYFAEVTEEKDLLLWEDTTGMRRYVICLPPEAVGAIITAVHKAREAFPVDTTQWAQA